MRISTDKNSMPDRPPLNVAIAGFGTVGQAVARILSRGWNPRLRLTHICNRNIEKKRVDWIPSNVHWCDQIDEVLASDVDVVIELIGGLEPATTWIRKALDSGKSVVTANKQVIARSGTSLLELSRQCGQRLCFEAAVAGGIPVIRGLEEGLAGDRLFRIQGILNGTCNYILTRMEHDQIPFANALKEAQNLGYAEADPTSDVDGLDAQAKRVILSAIGLRSQIDVDDVPLQTITTIEPIDFVYAKRLECTIRQIAHAELSRKDNNRILAWVQPALVPATSTLARVEGSRNIVVVEGEFGREFAFSGHGAGGEPTAVAVVSDLEAIARQGSSNDGTRDGTKQTERVVRVFTAPYYARFIVDDRPGIIAALADVFSRHGVNVDSVLQEPGHSKTKLPFVVTLESCRSDTVSEALREIESLDFHAHPPVLMPILSRGEES